MERYTDADLRGVARGSSGMLKLRRLDEAGVAGAIGEEDSRALAKRDAAAHADYARGRVSCLRDDIGLHGRILVQWRCRGDN